MKKLLIAAITAAIASSTAVGVAQGEPNTGGNHSVNITSVNGVTTVVVDGQGEVFREPRPRSTSPRPRPKARRLAMLPSGSVEKALTLFDSTRGSPTDSGLGAWPPPTRILIISHRKE